MADVFISHAVEDRPAALRLADALRCVGLTVEGFVRATGLAEVADEPDHALHRASAIVVLWSKHALSSEHVVSEASLALRLDAAKDGSASSRYAGLALGGVETSDLPTPFDRMETDDWESWFAEAVARFDDPQFVGLLASLEAITGQTYLNRVALTIATKDHEAEQLRTQIQSRDNALRAAHAGAADLQVKLEAIQQELVSATTDRSELEKKHAALDAAVAEQSARLSASETKLRDEQASASAAQSALETATRALHEAQAAKHALELDLEDAKNGLAASLRQQKSLQAQIHAGDESIREIMSQRELLILAKEKLEKDTVKLSTQLKDALQRLADTDQTRKTYESALIERNADIRKLEDRLSSSSAEIDTLRPQAEELSRVVKSWGHVPWRRVAAGAAAAGVAITFFVVLAERSIRWTTGPGPATPSAQAEVSTPAKPATEPTVRDPSSAKSSEKVEPDSLQLVDGGAPGSFDFRDPNLADTGEIPIPDESGLPISNDQVQFNPEGLPPADPYSRPPPQNLPPMPQKPRLLLKPPPPAAP
jgi:hypothetical protein